MSRMSYSDLESENKKLAKTNTKLQKDLEKANEQVEQLREAIDNKTTQEAEEKQASESLGLCNEDLLYEHRRCVVAENRAFELEQKVLALVNKFLPLDERRSFLSHLRLNGDGRTI